MTRRWLRISYSSYSRRQRQNLLAFLIFCLNLALTPACRMQSLWGEVCMDCAFAENKKYGYSTYSSRVLPFTYCTLFKRKPKQRPNENSISL